RISRQGPKQPENCRKERVLRREHDRRADNDRSGECGLHGRLAFAAAANIRRWRARIGAESREVHEPFGPGPPRRSGDPCGRFHVHRMKRICAMLDVEADRVDDAVGTCDGGLYGALVVGISGNLLEAVAPSLARMPRGDAYRGAAAAQTARGATASKTRPAKPRYPACVSCLP